MDIIIISILILLNGALAMAEIAIISAKRSKLQRLSRDGDKSAELALTFSKNPNEFLSSIQIGITLVGILAGVFGGAKFAEALSLKISQIPGFGPYSLSIALFIVVITITYLTLVIGELVPKRLAMSYPETISRLVARPVQFILTVTSPLVSFLSFSTDLILKILNVKDMEESVSEDEVKTLIAEGAKTGVFDREEKDILERTFKVGDKKVRELMTPRSEIIWIDINHSEKTIREKIIKNPLSYYPVCRGSLDKVKGVIRTEDLLTEYLVKESIEIEKLLYKPILVSENVKALTVLDLFKKSGIHMSLVLDEFGSVQGLISLADIMEAIVGNIPSIDEINDLEIVRRDDGSYLIDGLLTAEEFKEHFNVKTISVDESGDFNTIGGYAFNTMMILKNRIPLTGDKFENEQFTFEIMDMDGNRIDKLLVKKKK